MTFKILFLAGLLIGPIVSAQEPVSPPTWASRWKNTPPTSIGSVQLLPVGDQMVRLLLKSSNSEQAFSSTSSFILQLRMLTDDSIETTVPISLHDGTAPNTTTLASRIAAALAALPEIGDPDNFEVTGGKDSANNRPSNVDVLIRFKGELSGRDVAWTVISAVNSSPSVTAEVWHQLVTRAPQRWSVIPFDSPQGLDLEAAESSFPPDFSPWYKDCLMNSGNAVQAHAKMELGATLGQWQVSYHPTKYPIAAFGEGSGLDHLYLGRKYRFGIVSGALRRNPDGSDPEDDLVVRVYKIKDASGNYLTTPEYVGEKQIDIPCPPSSDPILASTAYATSTPQWRAFADAGFRLETYISFSQGEDSIQYLQLGVEFAPGLGADATGGVAWNELMDNRYQPLVLTCEAPTEGYEGNENPGQYGFIFGLKTRIITGGGDVNTIGFTDWSVNSTTPAEPAAGWAIALDFSAPLPAWTTTLLERPQFQGKPLPPTYYGKTPEEILQQKPELPQDLGHLFGSVQWTNDKNIVWLSSENGGTTLKTLGYDTWTAEASSVERFTEDFEVQAHFPNNSIAILGISDWGTHDQISHHVYESIQHGLKPHSDGYVYIFEDGSTAISGTSTVKIQYSTEDAFTIQRKGNVISYLKNGDVFYSSQHLSNGAKEIAVAGYRNALSTNLAIAALMVGVKSRGGALTDSDLDGMDDLWEASILTHVGSEIEIKEFLPGGDADNDGISNVDEYSDGSDPLDPCSYTEPIVWSGHRLTTSVGSEGGLQATGGSWNADAVSTRSVIGDTRLTFSFAQTNGNLMVGLVDENTNDSYTSLDYAIRGYTDGTADIYENGTLRGDIGSYTPYTKFAIERKGNEIRYLKDGVVVRVSTVLSNVPLFADCSFSTSGSSIKSARWVTGDGDNDGLPDRFEWQIAEALVTDQIFDPRGVLPEADFDGDGFTNLIEFRQGTNPTDSFSRTYPIVWTEHRKTANYGTTGGLQVIASSAWNGDAVSNRPMQEDTRLTVSVGQTTSNLMVGLTEENNSASYTDLEFAIRFFTDGSIDIYESGTRKAAKITTYTTSSQLSIERSGKNIRYLKDGVVFYVSSKTSAEPLYADCSFDAASGNISTAVWITRDGDDDGLPDSLEWAIAAKNADDGIDDPSDVLASGDFDGDGVSNLDEFLDGSNPMDELSKKEVVIWSGHVNCSNQGTQGGLLRGTNAAAWNSGAASIKRMYGDGCLTFKVGEANKNLIVGFSALNEDNSNGDVTFGIYANSGSMKIYELGASKLTVGDYTTTTTFQIKRKGSQVSYYKDGILVYTSGTASFGPLLADCSLYSVSCSLASAHWVTGDGDDDGLPDSLEREIVAKDPNDDIHGPADLLASADFDGDGVSNLQEFLDGSDPTDELNKKETVVWSGHTKCSNQGSEGGLLRDGSTSGWSAGAVSTKKMLGDGRLTFIPGEANKNIIVGFSSLNDGATNNLDFGIYANAGTARVYELGSSKMVIGGYTTSTKFSIERRNGKVLYYRDGLLAYISDSLSYGALIADVSLYHANCSLASAHWVTGDGDDDGLPDSLEREIVAKDPNDDIHGPADLLASADFDGDGVSNLQEFLDGTDPTDSQSLSQIVLWENFVKTLSNGVNGGLIREPTSSGTDADATASPRIQNEGSLTFRLTTTTSVQTSIGLSALNSNRTLAGLDYCIRGLNGVATIYESGSSIKGIGDYNETTRFSISRRGGVIYYWKDGVVAHTSTKFIPSSLIVDCNLAHLGSAILEARVWAPQPETSLDLEDSSSLSRQYLALDNAPEFLVHQTLDDLVDDMDGDPIALANYVFNHIELCDPISFGANGDYDQNALTPPGVKRNALAVYLEGQGSAIEQCSLLIYLLRKAGYPSAYVFPTGSGTTLLDSTVSKLLQMNIVGAANQTDGASSIPHEIAIKYPWVAVQVDGKWHHIFPWLKDLEVKEGLDVWPYMPESVNTPTKWIRKYIRREAPAYDEQAENESPLQTFVRTFGELLQTNYPEADISQFGYRSINRRHQYADWDDFPEPFKVGATEWQSALNQNWFEGLSFRLLGIDENGQEIPGAVLEGRNFRRADLQNRRLSIYSKRHTNGTARVGMIVSPYEAPKPDYSSGIAWKITTQSDFDNEKDPFCRNWQVFGTAVNQNETFIDYNDPELGPNETPYSYYSVLMPNTVKNFRLDTVVTHYHPTAVRSTVTSGFGNFDIDSTFEERNSFQVDVRSMASLCFHNGRVTDQMVTLQANELARLRDPIQSNLLVNKYPRPLNHIAAQIVTHVTGQNYFKNSTSEDDLASHFFKIRQFSKIGIGISRLDANTSNKLEFPVLDMSHNSSVKIFQGDIRADLGGSQLLLVDEHEKLQTVFNSAWEHLTLEQFYNSEKVEAVSAVKLLHLSSDEGLSSVIELNSVNYLQEGLKTYTFNGITKALQDWDSAIWESIQTSLIRPNGQATTVYITPGPKLGANNHYTGLGALILAPRGYRSESLINGAQKGAAGSETNFPSEELSGENLPRIASAASNNIDELDEIVVEAYRDYWNEFVDSYWQHESLRPRTSTYFTYQGPTFNAKPPNQLNIGKIMSQEPQDLKNFTIEGGELRELDEATKSLFNSYSEDNGQSAPVSNSQQKAAALSIASSGALGGPRVPSVQSNQVSDPVNILTGEFTLTAEDINLPGSFPLSFNRNYSSRNTSDQGLGGGWLPSMVPYLQVGGTNQKYIFAAEMDGTVLKYSRGSGAESNKWKVTWENNPELLNTDKGGLQHNYIQRMSGSGGSGSIYHLVGHDGSVRVFKVQSFAIIAPNLNISRERPYLIEWRNHSGNAYFFEFYEEPASPSFGRLHRIRSSSGPLLSLTYNYRGHLTSISSSDGRKVVYEYDSHDDLRKVVRPDGTTIAYDYALQEETLSAGGTTIATTHLLRQIREPEGRVLTNEYEKAADGLYSDKRRVLKQFSNVGNSSVVTSELVPPSEINKPAQESYKPRLSAIFDYSGIAEDPVVTDPQSIEYESDAEHIKTRSGIVKVYDAYGRLTSYEFSKNLLLRTTDPLKYRQETIYYTKAETDPGNANYDPGAYRRSVKKSTDRRGLITEYSYDARGNVKRIITSIDLNGNLEIEPNEKSITEVEYNSLDLPTFVYHPDPLTGLAGWKTTEYKYEDERYPYLATKVIQRAGNPLVVVGQTETEYGSIGDSLIPYTNALVFSKTSGIGTEASLTEWSYNRKGLPELETRYSGVAGVPNLVTRFRYNSRHEMVETKDAAGRKTLFAYDDMGRPIWQERLDASGKQVGWNYVYYNHNGDVEWTDGSRHNPEDYTYSRYDGMGRPVEKVVWRSEANDAGNGVQAVPGAAGYATTKAFYNLTGDLIKVMDPLGNVSRAEYDAIGRVTASFSYEGDWNPGDAKQSLDSEFILYGVNKFDANGGSKDDDADDSEVSFVQDSSITVTDGYGGKTLTYLTPTGAPRLRQNSDGSVLMWEYYLDGRIKKEPASATTYFLYTYQDADRQMTRTLMNSTGQSLGQPEIVISNSLGQVVKTINMAGYQTKAVFDHLGRTLKTFQPHLPANEASAILATRFEYDAAGLFTTTFNALNQKSKTELDALGRPLKLQTFEADGTLVTEVSYQYSDDHNRVTSYAGEIGDSSRLQSIVITNTFGQPVIQEDAGGVKTVTHYDAVGNPLETTVNGSDIAQRTSHASYDALGRTKTSVQPDGALTSYSYARLYGSGDLPEPPVIGLEVERRMPSPVNATGQQPVAAGFVQYTSFDSTGRVQETYLKGAGGATSKKEVFHYYPVPDDAADDPGGQSSSDGKLQSVSQQVAGNAYRTHSYEYDDWGRPENYTCDTLSKTIVYGDLKDSDPLKRLDTVLNETTPAGTTSIYRHHDPMGRILEEKIFLGAKVIRHMKNDFDDVGRRESLERGEDVGFIAGSTGVGGSFTFGWNAAGQLKSLTTDNKAFLYDWGTQGLAKSRETPWTRQNLTSRDTMGRLLQRSTSWKDTENTVIQAEALTWYSDSRLKTLGSSRRTSITDLVATPWDSRAYGYDGKSRRLLSETSIVGSNLNYQFDHNAEGGLGIRTKAQASIGWQSSVDPNGTDGFARVTDEQSTDGLITTTASGNALGAQSVSLNLQGEVAISPVTFSGPSDPQGLWAADLRLRRGLTYTLGATAFHPSGQHDSTTESIFTVANTLDQVKSAVDDEGKTTERRFVLGGRTQTLYWDGTGRLTSVKERDSQDNGYDWYALYDGLGRRLRTTTVQVRNNTPTSTIFQEDSWFDPLHEFLEVALETRRLKGESVLSAQRVWKVHGPDANGGYGDLQGIGGLEAFLDESTGIWTALIDDYHGNITGWMEDATSSKDIHWSQTHCSGYGPAPGSPIFFLAEGATAAQATAWRGRRMDITGLYWFGDRYYDSLGGRFLSTDPLGHDASMSLYSYADGDPVNLVDPTGRVSSGMSAPAPSPALPPMTMGGNSRTSGGYNPNADPFANPRSTLGGGTGGGGGNQNFDPYSDAALTAEFGTGWQEVGWRDPSNEQSSPEPQANEPQTNWVAEGASMAVGMIPFLGTAQSIVEVISGVDYITGNPTSRWVAGIGLVAGMIPGGKIVAKVVGKVGSRLGKAATKLAKNSLSGLWYTEEYMKTFVGQEVGDLVKFLQKKGFNVQVGPKTSWSIGKNTVSYEKGATRRWEILEEWLHGRVEKQGLFAGQIDELASKIPPKITPFGSKKTIKTDPAAAAEEILIKQYILKNLGRYLDDADKIFLQRQIDQLMKYGEAFGH